MASFQDLTTTQLRQILQLREQIESLQDKLDAVLGGASSSPTKGKRTMSAATIEKMRAAQQARWATIKGKSPTKKSSPAKAAVTKTAVKAVSKKKGGMSPEAKAKIAAAMKARWEAKRKETATS